MNTPTIAPSLCPCLRPAVALRVVKDEDGAMCFTWECPVHGTVTIPIERNGVKEAVESEGEDDGA